MSELKFTPGPWSKAETRTEGFVITSKTDLVVSSVDEYGHYGPIKNAADASLIAAAPDLLIAAITVLESLEARIDHAHISGKVSPVFTGIAELHAAINKATA
ncbi:hypothetical protein QN386_22410 [Pseudomonas sp. CCI3.2]|uniref:hypothetical protein n=1 Tax=unclassified Pseudomonas TaxID=196821 RepID=UPI002B22F04B|nr:MULTISPECIES: hypothetical protein [unclassified Pseudomonas]MEB0078051.1 hypothetical protein [Pseudomonas sp. MH10out]MEB0104058.1 hypothetical protein [Pseudomonas sp. CCI3.2]MEB0133404.1 hypothetical protein [Pseudomonas sp. CCI2.4]